MPQHCEVRRTRLCRFLPLFRFPMIDFAAARKHMVDSQVRPNDVTDLRLQTALEALPREIFLPPAWRDQAYVEREIAYAPGRRMLTARDFAKLVAAAEIARTDHVLDVACGSGYSTAVLARLAASVVGLDGDDGLCAMARDALAALGTANAKIVSGEPAGGAAAQGPFDVIFIGAAVAREPDALLRQLKDGGRLAVIKRDHGISRGTIYFHKDGATGSRALFDASTSFVLPGFEAAKGFSL